MTTVMLQRDSGIDTATLSHALAFSAALLETTSLVWVNRTSPQKPEQSELGKRGRFI